MKLNTDAALNMTLGNAGAAVVARDHSGSFLAGRYSQHSGITMPYIGEALACRDAMILAMERGWGMIEIETDWVQLSQRCFHISRIFRRLKFRGRVGNEMAHKLARHAMFFLRGS